MVFNYFFFTLSVGLVLSFFFSVSLKSILALSCALAQMEIEQSQRWHGQAEMNVRVS
jgi:hypothetical protein